MGADTGGNPPTWGAFPDPGAVAPSVATAWSGQPPTGAPVGPDSPVSAPVVWLGVVAGLELGGTILGLLASSRPTLSILGWLIGGFGAIGGLAWFTLQDSARRTSSWYSCTTAPGTLRAVLAGFAIAVVALNAAQFAGWASRQ